MATPNIVPRADSEGGLGTASKYWASAYIDTINATVIQSPLTDGDLILKADNGSGAMTEYFRLDGGITKTVFARDTKHLDSKKALFGDQDDLQIYHDGSTSGVIDNIIGDLYIKNGENDHDIYFQNDDGAGNLHNYLYLDGGEFCTIIQTATKILGRSFTVDCVVTSGSTNVTHSADARIVSGLLVTGTQIAAGTTIAATPSTTNFTISGNAGGSGANTVTLTFSETGNLTIGTNATSIQSGHEVGKINFQAPSESDGSDAILKLATIHAQAEEDYTASANSTRLVFSTSNGSTPSERMRIQGNGTVVFDGGITVNTTVNGIPFFTDGTSMYTHDVSGNGSYLNADNNTAYGFTALDAITTGDSNVAIGHRAGTDLSGGSQNVVIGKDAGFDLSQANYSIAIGFEALYSETVGHYSVAIGRRALKDQNVADGYNTAVGYHAAQNVTTGLYNTVLGSETLETNLIGDKNTAIGFRALKLFAADTDAHGNNTAVGASAGENISTGTENVAIGQKAIGNGTTTGNNNVAVGVFAGLSLSSGFDNICIGSYAGDAINTGSSNVALGYAALSSETSGARSIAIGEGSLQTQNNASNNYNVGIGHHALHVSSTGVNNTVIGGLAGDGITIGSNNVALGYNSLSAANAGNKSVAIGSGALAVQVPQFTVTGGAYNNDPTITMDATSSVKVGMTVTSSGGGVSGTVASISSGSVTTFELSQATTGGSLTGTLTFTGGVDSNNTAVGYNAGNDVTRGIANTLIGALSGDKLTTGANNVAVGSNSLGANISGNSNVALGKDALEFNTRSGANIAIGDRALEDMNPANDGNWYNIGIGHHAGRDISTGNDNIIIGGVAAAALNTGSKNVAIGTATLAASNGSESQNVAIGWSALTAQDNDANNQNTAVGYNAGASVTSGINNTILGAGAGNTVDTGSNNIIIGKAAAISAAGASNETVIGHTATTSALIHGAMTNRAYTGTAEGGGIDASDAVSISVGEYNSEIITNIFVDIGAGSIISGSSSTSVIGNATDANAYITRVTTAVNGIVYNGEMICLEAPTVSSGNLQADLDIRAVGDGTVASGTAMSNTRIFNSAGDHTLGRKVDMAGIIAPDQYLYITQGDTGQEGVYNAGKFLIRLYGAKVTGL